MSSKRDLVEAHSFNRRRLVTAFVSGAPGGREVEPVRYGRTLVGGLVLALLIVAGAAVSGFIKPSVPEDWSNGGLVVGKDSGSRFVAVEGTLYPVINTTSARLLLASDGEEMKVNFVPEDLIAEAPTEATIGIQGAPDALPAPSSLVQSGWTACTDSTGGLAVSVGDTPVSTPVTDEALRVVDGEGSWIVTGNQRYQLPDAAKPQAAVLRALGLDDQPERGVTGVWLDLFPVGDPLVPFAVDGAGTQVNSTGVPGLTRVGTPLLVDGRPYALGQGGTLIPLSPFAAAVYTSSGRGAQLARLDIDVSNSDVAGLNLDDDTPYPESWPQEMVEDYATTDVECARLDTEEGAAPVVSLSAPTESAPAIVDGLFSRDIQPGGGALVQASPGGVLGTGSVFLVDSTGTRYAVGTPADSASTRASLGYAAVEPPSVPLPWTKIFRDGPALTRSAAGQPPVADQQGDS
ncbi:type VII secretion protein EccB [Nocardioides sp. HDW12B]|uniref:type VII secretion protein EccB n=1 Tax=Nocardioides sp. HDW12B TaxID=2714939 RepID=UPI00140CC8C1|nr:type VII secretion protein EccB [Nocardioides sp. HDW12B]QIK67715.1 type VII secretion protein EccB [Nocardioides sp. HDW12B]